MDRTIQPSMEPVTSRRSVLEYLDNFYRNGRDIAYAQRRGYRMQRWNYRQVAELAAQFARELEARKIGKGDRVLLWSENSAQWVAAFFGCMLRGAVVVPMDSTAAPDFAKRVAEQVEAKLTLCSRVVLQHFPSIPALVLEDLPSIVAQHPDSPYSPPDIGRPDLVQIIFTSGATAEPKGVVITHGNILANLEPFESEIRKYRKYERIFHPIRFLCLLPLSHVFGQFLGIFIPQLIGGTVVFQESLSPSEIVRTLRSERVSVLVAVPRLLQSLKDKIERDYEVTVGRDGLREQMEQMTDKGPLRRWWIFRSVHRQFGWKFWALVSGGATLGPDTEEFWRKLGFAVIQGYGLTETTSLISVNHPFRQGKGSVGKILPGREMKLDASGEILVRGESVTAGYWRGQRLSPVLGEDGWFHTGDLGELDSEGRLHFKGRTKHVIVTREGINVYPEDLEAALRRQPEIRDCAVIGCDREGNTEACAFVILSDSAADPEAAIQRANASLAPHQKIRRWFVWPEPDFPRVSTQKIRTSALQQMVQQRTEGRAEPSSADTLAGLIAQITGRQPQKISADAHLEDDLNLSSLDRVELMCALEDRYKIDISDQGFAEVKTVAQLEDAVRHSAPGQTKYQYPLWAQRWPITWIRFLVYYLLVWPATMLLAKPRIDGRENLRGVSGPLLVISNHVTYIDIGFILAALPARFRHRLATAIGGEVLFAMRSPPKKARFLRRWIERIRYYLAVALFNVFPLPQRSDFRQSFSFAGDLADRRLNVLVFPEGERTPDGRMHAFRAGVGLLATRMCVPVLPMKIEGLHDLKVERRYFAPGRVAVKIGKPVFVSAGQDPDRLTRELESRVAAL